MAREGDARGTGDEVNFHEAVDMASDSTMFRDVSDSSAADSMDGDLINIIGANSSSSGRLNGEQTDPISRDEDRDGVENADDMDVETFDGRAESVECSMVGVPKWFSGFTSSPRDPVGG